MPGPDEPPVPEPGLTARLRHVGRKAVLEVTGEVDLANADTFDEALGRASGTGPDGAPEVVVLDLSGLTFLGSIGLSHLVKANQAAGPGVLRIVAGAAPRRAIEVTGLDQLLTLAATVEDALAVNT